MSGYYTYLVSSLPMLRFEQHPPFSFEEFLERCRSLVSSDDMKLLSCLEDIRSCDPSHLDETLHAWRDFECGVCNELVHVRAQHRHVDPTPFLRDVPELETTAMHAVHHAIKQPGILDAEKTLDRARWHQLDEIALNHFFDRAALLVYAIKLSMLIRWQRIRSADADVLLEAALAGPQKEKEQEKVTA